MITCTKISEPTQNKKFKVKDQEAAIFTVFVEVNSGSCSRDSSSYLTCKPEALVVRDNWQWVPSVQKILVKDSGFRRRSFYSGLRGEPRNEFCNTLVKEIVRSSPKLPYTTYHILAWKFFAGILTKSGKIGVPPPKDRHCCSYPNREEGHVKQRQEWTRVVVVRKVNGRLGVNEFQ
jgi:hypothetical protein